MYAFVALCAIAAAVLLSAVACLIVRHVRWRRRRRGHEGLLDGFGAIPVVFSDQVPPDKAIVIDPSKIETDFPISGGLTLYMHPKHRSTFAVMKNVTPDL
jgi:hypothetical protein